MAIRVATGLLILSPIRSMRPFVLSVESDVVIMADRTAVGLHSGCAHLEECSCSCCMRHATDVPDILLKLLNISFEFSSDTARFGGHEAKIKFSRTITSSFKTNGQLPDEPLEL
ncbi:hypothetical protein AB3S75_031394 [Citrus x aurantiifolia]